MNGGVVLGVFDPQPSRRRIDAAVNISDLDSLSAAYSSYLKGAQALFDGKRNLQVSSDNQRQLLVFENCVFQNNSHGPSSPMNEDGVITAYSFTDVVVKSCIFQSNNYSDPKVGVRFNTFAPTQNLFTTPF